jgi:hypothetical protein
MINCGWYLQVVGVTRMVERTSAYLVVGKLGRGRYANERTLQPIRSRCSTVHIDYLLLCMYAARLSLTKVQAP